MKNKPLFPLGKVVVAPGIADALEEADEYYLDYLERHVAGDWSDRGPEAQNDNRVGVEKGLSICSTYTLSNGVSIKIITEADRSTTIILLLGEC